MRINLTVSLASCVIVACGAMSGEPRSDVSGAPAAMVAAIRADAERRGGVPAGQLRVLETRGVTWRDGALGCPLPDTVYAQALVPGWRLLVVAGGQTLHYHASGDGQWLLCPAEQVQEPLSDETAR